MGAGAQVKISVLKEELAMEKAMKNEFHHAQIKVAKKARKF